MLKILKRLTAIVLSVMMLLTGGRGYADHVFQGEDGNTQGNIYLSCHIGADRAHTARTAATKLKRVMMSNKVNMAEICSINHVTNNVNEFSSIFRSEIQGNQQADTLNLNGQKDIIVASIPEFLKFPPTNIDDLERRSNMLKETTDFYSLTDLEQDEIDFPPSKGVPLCECRKCCGCSRLKCCFCCSVTNKARCCSAFKITPYVLLVLLGTALLIGEAVYFKSSKSELGHEISNKEGWILGATAVFLVVSVFLGATNIWPIGNLLKTCCKGFKCCCCCTNDNPYIKQKAVEELENGNYSYGRSTVDNPLTNFTNIFNDVYFSNDEEKNYFSDENHWKNNDIIIFFPIEPSDNTDNRKYVAGLMKVPNFPINTNTLDNLENVTAAIRAQ